MGADLYWAQRDFRPGKPRIRWLRSGNILVEIEVFHHGYKRFYRGPVTKEIKQVLKSMDLKVPEKP